MPTNSTTRRPVSKGRSKKPRPDDSGVTVACPPSGLRDYVAIAEGYRIEVASGAIVTCAWVKLACDRQRRDLARAVTGHDFPYRWDAWHANDVCDFIEKLPHIEGEWRTPTITLEPWQIFILTTVFGWRKVDGARRFNTVYFEVARKNAKSVLSSAVALYCLTCEGEKGPQVKCAATTGDQARIVFDIAKKMVERTSDLRDEFHLDALANAIVCYLNHGSIAPINAKSSTQDGLNPHATFIDELHAHKDRGLFDVLKSARGARRNPLSWYDTTAGYNMLGVCYEQRTFVTKVLLQVFDAEHYFGIIYTLDDTDDPFDEAVWPKANPNLGVSVQIEEFRGYAAEARSSPDSEGEYKTKRVNLWLNAAKAWLSMAQWDRCADSSLRLDAFLGMRCWIGGDLAQLDDIAAVALLFQRDHDLCALTRFYLPRLVVEERAKAVPAYRRWVDEGLLHLTEGNMIDYAEIESDIRGWCHAFNVAAIRFDQYGSAGILSNLAADGFPAAVLAKSAKNFTAPARDLETRVNHQRFIHDGNSCLKWMASNVVVRRGVDDSLLPKKETPESPNKIDGIDAILQAMSAIPEPVERPKDYQMFVLGAGPR